jgi:hypothetical protein
MKDPASDSRLKIYRKTEDPQKKGSWLKNLIYLAVFALITYFYFSGREEDETERRINELRYMKSKYADTVPIHDRLLGIGIIPAGSETAIDIDGFQSFVFQEHNRDINRPWGKYWAANKFESYCTTLAYTAHPDGNFDKGIIPDCIYELSRTTFPDMSEEIFTLYSKMHQYNMWVRQNITTDEWKDMSPDEREKSVWDTRYKLLGNEATEEIFKRKLEIYKSSAILTDVAENRKLPLNNKISGFKEEVNSLFGEGNGSEFIKNEKHQLMNKFLNSDSVQNDLSSLNSDERIRTLSEMRRDLGYSEQEIEQLAVFDAEKEKELVKLKEYGKLYSEYQSLYTEGELQSKLKELRESIFGADQAFLIESEEKRGMFRFKQKIKYGL